MGAGPHAELPGDELGVSRRGHEHHDRRLLVDDEFSGNRDDVQQQRDEHLHGHDVFLLSVFGVHKLADRLIVIDRDHSIFTLLQLQPAFQFLGA